MSRTKTASRAHLAISEHGLGAAIGPALPWDGAVSTNAFDLVIAAVDASHYLFTPRAVVTPQNAAKATALIPYVTEGGEPLTFRSGSTSLSGQASTGSTLVNTRKFFRSIANDDDGCKARGLGMLRLCR